MMRITLNALALVLLLAAGCAHHGGQLAGSWVLVESGGRTVAAPADESLIDRPAVKILTGDRFAFGYQQGVGRPWAGGGTYEYVDGVYRETVAYHSIPELVGLTIEFRCRVEGDVWHHSGVAEADGRRITIDEVWRRVASE